jgi:hypothetical protein
LAKANGNGCPSSATKSIAVAFKQLKKSNPANPSIQQILIQKMCGNNVEMRFIASHVHNRNLSPLKY